MLQSRVACAVDTRHRKLKRNMIQRSPYFARTVGREETVRSYILAVRMISSGFLGSSDELDHGFQMGGVTYV